MKTKFYWLALLASAAMIAQANAGGHHGGGGGGQIATGSPARGVSSFHSMAGRNFGGTRMMYSGRRFSPGGMRQFNSGSINRGNRFTRFGNNPRFAQGRNDFVTRNGAIANRRSGGGQFRNGNNLPPNWQNHVAERHSGNWHRDWDRGRDHEWHGRHCRFVNGSWVIFDSGFYPWWGYGYPYGYYGYYDYSPYGYDSDNYDPGYYDSGDYDSGGYGGRDVDDSLNSSVAGVQEQLARRGYYHGEIDGVIGPQTRRALARYQSSHGLRASGQLTTPTLEALGLGRVASY